MLNVGISEGFAFEYNIDWTWLRDITPRDEEIVKWAYIPLRRMFCVGFYIYCDHPWDNYDIPSHWDMLSMISN